MKHDGNDLLRRQDCINAIEEITSSMVVCVNTDECHGMKRMQRQAVLEITNMPAVQPDHVADIGKKVSISCGQENDLISRQMAIGAVEKAKMAQTSDGEIYVAKYNAEMNIQLLPTVQPDRDVIDDCLCHIYKNISVHTATGGVIAIRYYMEKLYEEIYGEGERPWWMT